MKRIFMTLVLVLSVTGFCPAGCLCEGTVGLDELTTGTDSGVSVNEVMERAERNGIATYDIITAYAITETELEDIRKALAAALVHLDTSHFTTTIYRTPADELRYQADMIEQQERDIAFIREVLFRVERRLKE